MIEEPQEVLQLDPSSGPPGPAGAAVTCGVSSGDLRVVTQSKSQRGKGEALFLPAFGGPVAVK